MSRLAPAIVQNLRARYDLEIHGATPLAGGYDAWADCWRIDTDRGTLVLRADRGICIQTADDARANTRAGRNRTNRARPSVRQRHDVEVCTWVTAGRLPSDPRAKRGPEIGPDMLGPRPKRDRGAPLITVSEMADVELEALLAEQVAYYRARAGEYDQTSPFETDALSRETLTAALEVFAPKGRVLEFACGAGQWTAVLAKHAAELTAIDASPEMLALAAQRVRGNHVRFIQADILQWQPDQHYDVVFFSAWLSHVPPQRFERFWMLVADCLSEGGRVFLIDELPAAAAVEQAAPGAAAPVVERPLNSGTRYRTIKVFHDPDELSERLARLGWDTSTHRVGWRFFYATGNRKEPVA